MIARSISHLMLWISLGALHQNVEATQGTTAPAGLSQDCLDQLAKVDPPLPTVRNILDVDPVKVPWGVNLNLVDEFASRFRNTPGIGDACNFAARITLYQKHKSIAKNLSEQYASISEKINTYKEDLKKLQDEKSSVRKKMDNNGIMLKTFAAKIRSQIGLKAEQIAKLPDLNTWNAMKKESQQVVAPQRPQTAVPSQSENQAGSTPARRQPIRLAPQRNSDFK
jgi:hypothetical protein